MVGMSKEEAREISLKLIRKDNLDYLLMLQDLKGKGLQIWLKRKDRLNQL
jgi:hypothetical protein